MRATASVPAVADGATPSRALVGYVLRALCVGAGYTLALLVGAGLLTALGLPVASGEGASGGSLVVVAVSGVVVGLAYGPLAARLPASRRQQVAVWTTLLFANTVGVVAEGRVFAPSLVPVETLPGLLASQFVVALAAAGLLTALFATGAGTERAAPRLRDRLPARPAGAWAGRFLLAVAVYVALFYVVGRVNYELVTRPYYEAALAGLAPVSLPVETLLLLEAGRGLLIVGSVVPLALLVRGSPRRRALVVGGALYVAGGLLPLLLQVGQFPPAFLVASGAEILLQLGPTGAAVAVLFGTEGAAHRPPGTETV